MGNPSGNYAVSLIIPSYILFKDRIPCSAFGDQVLAPALLYLFPTERIIFKHFDVEGHSKKEVNRVTNNTTIVKIRTFNSLCSCTTSSGT
jgi:hypothetical protein